MRLRIVHRIGISCTYKRKNNFAFMCVRHVILYTWYTRRGKSCGIVSVQCAGNILRAEGVCVYILYAMLYTWIYGNTEFAVRSLGARRGGCCFTSSSRERMPRIRESDCDLHSYISGRNSPHI